MAKRSGVWLAAWLTIALTGLAQTPDLTAIGPKVGTAAQDFSGVDQSGRPHTLTSLMGRDGLMLVFFRSADW